MNLLAGLFGSGSPAPPAETSNAGSPTRTRMRRGKTMSQTMLHPRNSYDVNRKWIPEKVLDLIIRIEAVLDLAKHEGALFYPTIELGQLIERIMGYLKAELTSKYASEALQSDRERVLYVTREATDLVGNIAEGCLRLIFSNNYILSLFSSVDLISIFELLPLQFACAMMHVHDTRPYRRDFKKMLEFFYRVAAETSGYWDKLSDSERSRFYHFTVYICVFFNQMIMQERAEDPNVIEKELPYFDALFSIYQMFNLQGVLDSYTASQNQIGDPNQLDSVFIERCQMVLGLKVGEDAAAKIDLIRNSSNPEFDMLLYLLQSMAISCKRFIITDTSHTVRRNMCTFMTDLLTFVDKNIRLTQMSLDEEKEELVADKTVIFQGYDQLVARNGHTMESKESATNFVRDARDDKTLTNKYALALLPVILNLQNKLAFSYEECLLDLDTEETLLETKSGSTLHRAGTEDSAGAGQQDASKSENNNRAPSFFTNAQATEKDYTTETAKAREEELARKTVPVEEVPRWRPDRSSLLEVCVSNLRLIGSQTFLTLSSHPNEYSWRIMSAFTRQVVLLIRKFDLLSKGLQANGITLDTLTKFFYSLLKVFETLDFDCKNFQGEHLEAQLKAVENTLAEILDLAQRFQVFWRIPTEFGSLRRVSLYFDDTNLLIMRKTLENSGKYQSDIKPYVNNSYYKNILRGRVEMEVEAKELTYGVARSFIKIFQKMQLRGDLPRYLKLEKSIEQMIETHYDFCMPVKGSIHANEHHKYLLSLHSNYFYNDLFRRASMIFEMLLGEIPELKYAIYSEHLKNYMILKFFSNKTGNLKKSHPCMKNLYDLSINLSGYCFRSVLLNDSFGIIHSRFAHTLSLLNNFVLDNSDAYKDVASKIGYYDTNLKLYQNPDNLFDESFYFERDQTYIVSICCRLDTWLLNNGFDDKLKLGRLFHDDYILATLPLVTSWIEFLDSIINNKRPELCQYVYNKLFLRFLLRILFAYDDMSNINLIQFKKAVAGLYFKIGTEDIMENTLKYQFDMKTIYDSLIKVTRIQFLALKDAQNNSRPGSSNETKIVAATARERRRLKKQQEDRDSLSLFKSIGTYTQKHTYSRNHLFDPFIFEKPSTDSLIKAQNIILFGGAMFYNIDGQMSHILYESPINVSLDSLITCYKTSDNRDLGFQFINSLAKILNKFDFTLGTKFWSARKEAARVYFEIDQTPLPEVKKFELKLVYVLSMINKQIEVVDQRGDKILISFRKYPEIYTVNQLDPIKYMPEFHFEDFKRDTLKIISKLSTMTTIEYRMMQVSGKFYKYLSSDALRRYPYIPWYFTAVVNILIIANYINPGQVLGSSDFRSNTLDFLIILIGWITLGISSISLLIWLYTRLRTIQLANRYNFGSKQDVDVAPSRHSEQEESPLYLLSRKLFSFIMESHYLRFIKDIFADTSAMILIIHIIVSILGLFVDQLINGFAILTFIYTSSTAQNVLRSITTNYKPILIALVWILLEVYFYTVIWFFNFYDYFDPSVFPEDGHPCHSLSACYFTVIDYGLRMGGGLGEVTKYVAATASNFETKILFDLSFFFFVNITGLNLIFGIIIDTFGQLREDANEKRSIMESVCLVCGVGKTDFEASGINFEYHVKQQHNLSDYAAFLIRLQINKNRLTHDIDYKIKKHLDNLEVSWFPNRSTHFLKSLKNVDKKEEDPVMLKLLALENTVAAVEEALENLETRVLIPTKTLVDDR